MNQRIYRISNNLIGFVVCMWKKKRGSILIIETFLSLLNDSTLIGSEPR